jgi:hypothetical protein
MSAGYGTHQMRLSVGFPAETHYGQDTENQGEEEQHCDGSGRYVQPPPRHCIQTAGNSSESAKSCGTSPIWRLMGSVSPRRGRRR